MDGWTIFISRETVIGGIQFVVMFVLILWSLNAYLYSGRYRPELYGANQVLTIPNAILLVLISLLLAQLK